MVNSKPTDLTASREVSKTVLVSPPKTAVRGIFPRVSSNLMWLLLSDAIGKGVFFLTTIYLARTLGVVNFGLFTLAQTIVFYCWLGVELGTTMYGIREIAKDKNNVAAIMNPLLTMRITSGLVVFSLYFLVIFFRNGLDKKSMAFIGCAFYLITYAFNSDWVLKGLEQFKYIAYGSLTSALFFLGGTLYFVRSEDDLIGSTFIWSFSFLVGALSLLFFLYRNTKIKFRPSFNYKVWGSHVKESIYITISGSLMILYQFAPIFFIGIFSTHYELGLYSAPYGVIIKICSTGFLLPMAFYPILSELFQDDKRAFKDTHSKFQLIMLSLSLPVAILGTIFADGFVRLLFGDQYYGSIELFRILIWFVPLYFFRSTFATTLLAVNLHRHTLIGTAPSLIFVVILCLLFRNNLIRFMPFIVISGEVLLIILFIATYKIFLNRVSA